MLLESKEFVIDYHGRSIHTKFNIEENINISSREICGQENTQNVITVMRKVTQRENEGSSKQSRENNNTSNTIATNFQGNEVIFLVI